LVGLDLFLAGGELSFQGQWMHHQFFIFLLVLQDTREAAANCLWKE
jgi:hypothetical protein